MQEYGSPCQKCIVEVIIMTSDGQTVRQPWQIYCAEMLGTCVLVFIGCGAVVTNSMSSSGAVGLVGIALSFGMAVAMMIYAVGPISGAHINPAVTVALAAAESVAVRRACPKKADPAVYRRSGSWSACGQLAASGSVQLGGRGERIVRRDNVLPARRQRGGV